MDRVGPPVQHVGLNNVLKPARPNYMKSKALNDEWLKHDCDDTCIHIPFCLTFNNGRRMFSSKVPIILFANCWNQIAWHNFNFLTSLSFLKYA
jgi:hypothetical protein